MNYAIGSTWRRWDLHIHTPYSLVHNYSSTSDDDVWDRFIQDLENLPDDIKTIGINDYLFIDGYKKVLEYKKQDRLQNIDLILPVIELRLSKFVGTDTHWNKLNFHVIFGDESVIAPSIIEQQFLSQLSASYKLSPDYLGKIDWQGVITKDSLQDLGDQIIKSAPEEKRKDYFSSLKEGFNNLNFEFDDLLFKLSNNSYLKGKCFTAIGKTEWSALSWGEKSIAEKRNIINKSDFVFTCARNISQLRSSKEKLTQEQVNNRLLDCSDAHNFSTSDQCERIGKCFTWIKADTSFEGLRQTLYEPDRIYLGDVPPKIQYIEQNKTKFIESIQVKKKSSSTFNENWFNVNLNFNKALIAIIGNKGSGKSALLDIIGLLGGSKINRKHLPFLNNEKFLKNKKASNFVANLRWVSGDESGNLSLDIDQNNNSDELIRYIPQNYFEEICNQLANNSENSGFYKELSKVIFSHVKTPERLGRETIDELILHHREEIDNAIDQLRLRVNETIQKRIALEEKLKPEYKATLKSKLEQKNKELVALMEPVEVKKPDEENQGIQEKIEKLANKKEELESYQQKKVDLLGELKENNKTLVDFEKLKRRIENFEEEYKHILDDLSDDEKQIVSQSITIKINYSVINQMIDEEHEKIKIQNDQIAKVVAEIDLIQENIKSIQEELDAPNRMYQKYLNSLEIWEKNREQIIGDEDTPETITYLQKQIEDLQLIEQRITQNWDTLLELVKKIYLKKSEIQDIYKRLYLPVQTFIQEQDLGEEFNLQFSVSIEIEGFSDRFFSYISHGCSGTFYGIENGEKKLNEITSKYNFNEFSDVKDFLKELIDSLVFDLRKSGKNKNTIEDQLLSESTKEDFYQFIYSLNYLLPRFVLKLGDKDIQVLSPGEKGTLLLVFYLLIDKDNIPLLIDQPEHNLDNQTVYKLLVECVKEAKQKRQIFIVTHNPNLAVVCDAEQIICAHLDKEDGHKITYNSGAIENPGINKKIIDILEGTKPAFDKRRFKYLLDQYDLIE